MRFQVPQFTDVEDKIIGPFTIKQFVYLVGGGAISFIAYRSLPIFLSIFIILPVVVFSIALAFSRINDRPFILILESALKYFINAKLYLWKKNEIKAQKRGAAPKAKALLSVPKLGDSKLKDLTWNLDVNKEALNPVTKDQSKKTRMKEDYEKALMKDLS